MKRVVAILFVGMFFLVPATSWSKDDIEKLATRVAQLEAQVAALQAALANEASARSAGDASTLTNAKVYTDDQLLGFNTFVTGLENYLSIDTTNHRLLFHGVNIQLVNGTGSTFTVNSLGNLIIGYDTSRPTGPDSEFVCGNGWHNNQEACEDSGQAWAVNHKNGSHNLVIGDYNNYSQPGGFVAGEYNTINGYAAVVSGGMFNKASRDFSVVSGGCNNYAWSQCASVSGGGGNAAIGDFSSISGGQDITVPSNYGYAP